MSGKSGFRQTEQQSGYFVVVSAVLLKHWRFFSIQTAFIGVKSAKSRGMEEEWHGSPPATNGPIARSVGHSTLQRTDSQVQCLLTTWGKEGGRAMFHPRQLNSCSPLASPLWRKALHVRAGCQGTGLTLSLCLMPVSLFPGNCQVGQPGPVSGPG